MTTGTARLGRRTKELTARLEPGAVAVLDHADIDAVAARGLIRCRPAAVLNQQPFVTGRYPNRGPDLLLAQGIPLFEARAAEDDLFLRIHDGETVAIRSEGTLYRAGRDEPIARLSPLTADILEGRLAEARENLDAALVAFAQNTLRYLESPEERALLLDPVSVPDTRVSLAGRPALVVARGDGYEEDLRGLLPYIRRQEPVILAVDGAADALLALGVSPHILLGDMDSVSDAALSCGAERIVHAYARSTHPGEADAPGLARVRALGLSATLFPVAGTSEDAALLLAYEKGAERIVAVGMHTSLEDFLDKGRDGMASTFLVRLKVGRRLIDARGLAELLCH